MDIELHKIAGYAIFLIAVSNMALALTVAKSDASMAKVMRLLERFGVIWLGRLEILMGLGVVMHFKAAYLTSDFGYAWQVWVSILLWGPVEVVSKRLIGPELLIVEDGGQGSGRLTSGAGVQLLIITAIFGLMHTVS